VIAYVDASVLLRVVLGQRDSLPEWSTIERGVSSALVTAECLRTLDRLRLRVRLADSDLARRRAKILELIASLDLVDVDSVVLDRASQPMPTELGTLDAIHLATALLWKEMTSEDLTMATHDAALAIAAEAHALPVLGVGRRQR
jgi:predicted nucleic acid-binding protein